MKVPKEIVRLVQILDENAIDYRIVGGQAAVLYGLRDRSEDWDIAVATVTPELKEIMKTIGFTEIPDSEGKSWEGKCLVDFVIGDGTAYPMLEELGLKETHSIKFVSRSMMGYINWKDGKSAFQKLEHYKQELKDTKLPKAIMDKYNVDWLRQADLSSKLRRVLAYKAPVIGFDLDDTLVDLNSVLVKALNKRGYDVSHEDRTHSKWEHSSTKPIPPQVMMNIFDELIATGHIAELPSLPGAKELLELCKSKGARIVLITARPEAMFGELTRKWLAAEKIPYDALYFAKDKKPIADKEGVDLFIDDDVVNAFDHRVVLLDQPWNKDHQGEKVQSLDQVGNKIDQLKTSMSRLRVVLAHKKH